MRGIKNDETESLSTATMKYSDKINIGGVGSLNKSKYEKWILFSKFDDI